MIEKIKEIKGIDNSSWLKCLTGNIIYALKEGSSTYINDKSFNRYLSILGFSNYDNDLYFFENNVLFKFEENKLIEKYKLKDVDFLKIVTDNILFSRKQISRKEYKYSLYDFDYNLLWSNTETERIVPFKDFAMYNARFNQTNFEARDIKTGEVLWKYKTEDEFKIPINTRGNFNIEDNILVIAQVKQANPINKVMLVGLDVNSGKELWRTIEKSDYHIVNKTNDLLYAFASNIVGNNFLIELNPKTGEFKETHFDGFKGDAKPHLCAIQNNKLYFSNNKIGCGIGVIDIDTKEIIEEYEFGFREGVMISAPQISNDKIYVLDTLNTIHVLEHNKKTLEV